jgi:putative ABC transport system permease protein
MIRALAMIVLRDWGCHKLRLTLTTAGIALGVAAFFAIQTTNDALVGSLNGTIEKLAGKATLQAAAGNAGFSFDAVKTVRSTPGVKIAEPVTETLAATTLGGTRLLILGLDTASDLQLYNTAADRSDLVIKNPLVFASRKDSVAITSKLAERFGLKDGDKISVETSSGPAVLTVRGIFAASGIGDVYDGNVAVMDIYSAWETFGRGNRIDRIDISTDNGADVDAVQKELAARLGPGIDVVRPDLRGKSLENSVTTMHAGFTILSIVALMIGVFIIFNSFTISVNQRWKEIAILRSIGVERRGIKLMFLAEAVILGVIGSGLGIAIGLLMSMASMGLVTRITATVYGIASSTPELRFDPAYAAAALAVGIASSLIAAWVPARAAASLDPAAALRNIETRRSEPRMNRLRLAVGALLVAAGLLGVRITPPGIDSYIQATYSFMIQFGMIMMLPIIISAGGRVLRPVMDRLFGAEGVIAVETMARSPRRTAATVGAIMIGLTFAISNASLIQSLKLAIDQSLDKALAADIVITSSDQLSSRSNHFSDASAAAIASLDGIEAVDRIRVTTTKMNDREVALLAHDMGEFFRISPDLLDSGDPVRARELTSRGEGVVISNNLAFRSNLKLGDALTIRSPKGDVVLPIVGMLDYYRSEHGTIFLERSLYRRYWDDADVDYIFIDLKPGTDREAFKSQAAAALAGTRQAFIYTHEEYKQFAGGVIDRFFLLMYMQTIIAIIVAAIGLVNTMLISVAERKREIGIFRAIGGLRRQVVKMVLLEAVAISLVGFAAGAVTSLLNTYFLINTAAKVVAGFRLPFHFSFWLLGLAVPAVIAMAMISAWFPARGAARLEVADAIGYE